MSLIHTLKHESNFKLFIAGTIVLIILVIAFNDPYDEEYLQEVERELIIAKNICESSVNYVAKHSKKLKLGNNVLDKIPVNGKIYKLEHVDYPKVLFFHTGYKHKNAGNELYCSSSDPRGSSKDFFFDYEYRRWVKQMRMRR